MGRAGGARAIPACCVGGNESSDAASAGGGALAGVFVVSVGPTAVGAAMAGVRSSVGVEALTRGLADKLAGGAALRASGPLMGRAAGFIVAAAAGVGIDIALRKLDELLNRDELEQALTTLVDEEKEGVKAALAGAVDEVKVAALGEFVPSRLR